jgi:chromosome segregation ATPase
VEGALEVYRKVVASIEESGDVAKSVLEDAVPKLHAAANRLVDVGANRDKAATVIEELKSLTDTRGDHTASIDYLEREIQDADAEISKTYDQLLALRAKVAQVAITNSPEDRATAFGVNNSLDELNLRLEALEETMTSQEEHLPSSGDQPE